MKAEINEAEILQRLYDSEICFSLWTTSNFMVGTLKRPHAPTDTTVWLKPADGGQISKLIYEIAKIALEEFPESEFAKWWLGQMEKDSVWSVLEKYQQNKEVKE